MALHALSFAVWIASHLLKAWLLTAAVVTTNQANGTLRVYD